MKIIEKDFEQIKQEMLDCIDLSKVEDGATIFPIFQVDPKEEPEIDKKLMAVKDDSNDMIELITNSIKQSRNMNELIMIVYLTVSQMAVLQHRARQRSAPMELLEMLEKAAKSQRHTDEG